VACEAHAVNAEGSIQCRDCYIDFLLIRANRAEKAAWYLRDEAIRWRHHNGATPAAISADLGLLEDHVRRVIGA
jgi:hypothetical protein